MAESKVAKRSSRCRLTPLNPPWRKATHLGPATLAGHRATARSAPPPPRPPTPLFCLDDVEPRWAPVAVFSATPDGLAASLLHEPAGLFAAGSL